QEGGPGPTNLPTNLINYRPCGFDEQAEQPPAYSNDFIAYDVTQLDPDTLIINDPFISSKIVKKIRIKGIDYLTYNASGQVLPVVGACNIKLEIFGSPEVYAFRLRNENQIFKDGDQWIPWSPEISNQYMEKEWLLSSQSGIKQICVQAMTYAGLMAEFCISLIADYDEPIYEIKLYDQLNDALLPNFGLLPVASTMFTISEEDVAEPNQTRMVDVEIVPRYISNNVSQSIFFDVLHQGTKDLLRIETDGGVQKLRDGRDGYKGEFEIHVEDNIQYKDGLAKIVVRISKDCATSDVIDDEPVDGRTTAGSDSLGRFNFFGDPSPPTVDEVVTEDRGDTTDEIDQFAQYRQDYSGRIGTEITIRPTSDDPDFVFGDPNYYLQKQDPKQEGSTPPEDTV
ncbi:MAG: hypothetical protein KAH23_10065, partial [Kiritimatiellae bacterium]|nr:hypothetical protein [Kiritimatiellia bacterium]